MQLTGLVYVMACDSISCSLLNLCPNYLIFSHRAEKQGHSGKLSFVELALFSLK